MMIYNVYKILCVAMHAYFACDPKLDVQLSLYSLDISSSYVG